MAARMYKGPMAAALRAAKPRLRTYTVLEDNDPTGFKSTQGEAAKRKVHIKPFCIPKRSCVASAGGGRPIPPEMQRARSPDLNVLDYAIWKNVNRKMREQERRMAKSKRETRAEYTKRLLQAARLALSPDFLKRSIVAMKRRCRLLFDAKGGYFQEGGRG